MVGRATFGRAYTLGPQGENLYHGVVMLNVSTARCDPSDNYD